jgi:hypothetical protein
MTIHCFHPTAWRFGLEIFRANRPVIRALGLCCLMASATACASADPYNPDHLPLRQMSQIGQVCRTIMGLPPGTTTQNAACEESLSHSFAALHVAGEMQQARAQCLARGLKPGDLALSECELGPQPAGMTQAAYAAIDPPAKPPKSYLAVSNNEVHRREQLACAAVGYDPATAGSAQCVADLDSAMFEADNPMQ